MLREEYCRSLGRGPQPQSVGGAGGGDDGLHGCPLRPLTSVTIH